MVRNGKLQSGEWDEEETISERQAQGTRRRPLWAGGAGDRELRAGASWRKQRPAQTLGGALIYTKATPAPLESRKLAHLSKGFPLQNAEKGQEGWNFQELKLVIIASTSRHCAKYFPSANSVHLPNNATTTPIIRTR